MSVRGPTLPDRAVIAPLIVAAHVVDFPVAIAAAFPERQDRFAGGVVSQSTALEPLCPFDCSTYVI